VSPATEFPGQGEAKRSLSLLWSRQRQPTRGPKPGLSVDSIVSAAIELADAEGLAALSMRRVAERLGVGTMSLYTYVPAKAELLDLMVDAVFGEHVEGLQVIEAQRDAAFWRRTLESQARAGWDLYLRHPWMLGVASTRSVLGPNEMTVFELSLRAVSGLGLSGREMLAATSLVATYVRGAARAAAEAIEAPTATGKTDTEWWLERAPLLDEMQVFDPERFPTVIAVGEDGGYEVSSNEHEYMLQYAIDDFEFGLQRVLDGLGKIIERRARSTNVPERSVD
jgi:AcrR family transcriptional regulator